MIDVLVILIFLTICIVYVFTDNIEYWWDIQSFFKYNQKYHFFRYDIKHGIKRLIEWFPTIFKDRHWDFIYTYEILKKKIELQRKHFEIPYEYSSIDWETQVKQLKFCEKILDRLIEDHYLHPDYGKMLEGYRIETVEEKRIRNGKEETVYRMVDTRPEEIQIEHDRIMRKSWDWEKHWKERDKRLLYKMLEKYAEEWWD